MRSEYLCIKSSFVTRCAWFWRRASLYIRYSKSVNSPDPSFICIATIHELYNKIYLLRFRSTALPLIGSATDQRTPMGPVRLTHIRLVRLVFSADTVFFSHNNSTRTVFSANFSQDSASRTGLYSSESRCSSPSRLFHVTRANRASGPFLRSPLH